MKVGLQISLTNIPQKPFGDYFTHIAEQAEQAGFSTLTVPDHFSLKPESTSWMPRNENTPAVMDFLEAYSVLAYMAASTKRIRLTTLVSGITMRYPAVLVKTVDTLDALSNGRAYLGLGASPDFGADEHARMGLPFPQAGERVSRLEEVLKMALQLWSDEDKPFDGTYYHLASTIGNPLYVQRPHPPILIAGYGNRMLRLMAQYAGVVSIGFGGNLDDLRTKLEQLQGYCQKVNRSYTDIEKTTFFTAPIVRDGQINEAALEYIHSLATLGIDEVMIRFPTDPATLNLLASEFIPTVEKIPTAGR